MGWLHFNDRLALGLLFFIIPAAWVLDGLGIMKLSPEVNGALIATWTLLIQYYWRKQPPSNGGTTNAGG